MNTSILTAAGAVGEDALPYLAVHYLHTCKIRHWVSQEVFLDPYFLILKVYATIANIGLDFVPSSYPQVGAANGVNLPLAFINGEAADVHGIIRYMQSIVDIDSSLSDKSNTPAYERDCLQTYGTDILKTAILYALFGAHDCFQKFTSPIFRDSISRPYGDQWLSDQKAHWVNRDRELISKSLWKLLKQLVTKIGWGSSRKFFFDSEKPSFCDVVLYSYLSILLSIPEKFIPYTFLREDKEEDEEEIVHRIKTFLLDFDDWLWQLSSKRATEHATKLINSAASAAKGSLSKSPNAGEPGEDVEDEENRIHRPFLGKDHDARKSNLIFIGIAATAMVCVGYMSS